MIFKDREDAGRKLAKKLMAYQGKDAIVLALPRGGIPAAVEIAKALDLPLDITVARKLGAPGYAEFGVGAIAQGGIMVLNPGSLEAVAVTEKELKDIITEETAEMERRIALYRGNRHNPQIKGKIVILVDDGLATGVTAQAAIRSLKLGQPKKLILAVPVCAQDTADIVAKEVDELICLYYPRDFTAVGVWYENFGQLNDQEVIDMLAQAHRDMKVG
jgi:putative phosphoribosyl transferase